MNKAYERINWENYPSENTALDEINLNKMDAALNEVDNRVVAHETTKLDLATANSMVKNLSFNERTGIFTVTYLNGSTKELDTKLEKIATNFVYDEERQKLILTLIDGTTQEIDMSALITQYEFENSAYISFTVVNGKVKAEIINGSITADKLQPNFLADVTLQANSAKTSEQNAKTSEENAKKSEISAKNYADSAEPVASTANGLNPTLDNSTAAPIISFKGDGATEQQTYSGKNKLPLALSDGTGNGISYTADKTNGVITLNGTATADTIINIATNGTSGNFLELNTEYIVSFGEEVAANEKVVMAVGYRKVGGSTYEYPVYSWISKEVKFALTEEYEALIIRVRVDSGTTVSNLKVYPMIRLATETDDTYEKFVGGTASPNPSYPQEIYGVGESGSLSVKSTGACIFGGLPFAQALVDTGSTNVVLDTDAKTVTFKNNTNSANKSVLFNKFKENTQYTFRLKGELKISGATPHTINLSVYYTDGTRKIFEFSKIGEFDYLYTTTENKSVDRFIHGFSDTDTTTLYYEECGIFEGAITADEFEPYTETAADIPLSSPLYEGDYIRYNMDGSGEESHKQFEMILDGSEVWVAVTPASDTGYYRVNVGEIGKYIVHGVISSHFTQAIVNTATTAIGIDVLDSTSVNKCVLAVRPNIDGVTDLATWKAWLAENKPKVVCELTEPTVTPLTAEQIAEFEKLRTFDGTTHVTCDAESEVQYFYDSVSGKSVAMVASKANTSAELPIGSVIMIEEQNTELPKYGTWYYLFTQTIDGEEGGAPRAVSVKLYQREE